MTQENQNILEDFYSGNSKYVIVTVTDALGNAKDLTNAEIVYTIYLDSGAVVVYKTTEESNQISISGADDNIATVTLTPADTYLLSGLYRHEMTITDLSGNQETVMRGKVQIFKSRALRRRYSKISAYLLGG